MGLTGAGLTSVALTSVALTSVPGTAVAQVTTATVYGLVTDATGAVLPGADVSLTNEATAARITDVTSERGEFTLTFLPVGRYTLTVTLASFTTHEARGLALSAGQTVRLSVPLTVSGVTDTVSVTAGAPRINRGNAQQQSVIGDQQLLELPLATRDWSRTVELDTSLVRNNNGFAMHGLPPAAFTVTVDGTNGSSDAERASIGQTDFNVINAVGTEAIEEISVSTGIASAEFGGTMAGNVNLVTRSGSNAFRGSLFEHHQRDELDATNPFVAQTPDKTYHQFGGSLGGPILRNRLFFFGAYEGVRSDRMTVERGSVPTPEWRAEALAANPVYAPFFAMFPTPEGGYAPGARTASHTVIRPETRDDSDATARVDLNLSAASRMSGRYSGGRPSLVDPRLIEANPRTFDGVRDSASVSFTHTARGWVSETRAGYNRSTIDRVDQLYTLNVPLVSVSGTSLSSGEYFHKNGSFVSVDQVVATSRGRHALKLGVNLLHQRAGRANFNAPEFSYSSIADFYANIPSTSQFTFGLDEFELRGLQIGGFVQDDVRIGSRLVLNLGLRYDYFTVPEERDGRVFNRDLPWGLGPIRPADRMYDADYNNVSPRAGLAWAPDQRSVIRGGVGVFVNQHPLYGGPVDLVLNSAEEQFRVSVSRQDALARGIRYPMTAADVEPLVQGPAALWSNRSISPDFPNPYSVQWTVTAEREIGASYSVEVGYVGNRAEHLNTVRDINRPDRLTGLRPHEGFGVFGFYDSSNSSDYRGVHVGVRRRFVGRVGFGARYTHGRSMSNGSGDLLHEDRPQESFDLDAERGPTRWDVRHRFAANFIYELSAMGERALVRALTRGWQIAGIFTARSGEAVNVLDNQASYRSQRPDYVGGDMVLPDWRETRQYLNPAAFQRVPIVAASGTTARAGTLGWNAVRGPALYTLDLGLSRNVYIGRVRAQIRVDLFNALNIENYGSLSTGINSADFGKLNSVSTRTMQIGGRLSF